MKEFVDFIGEVVIEFNYYDEDTARIAFVIPEDQVDNFLNDRYIYNGIVTEARDMSKEEETTYVSYGLFEKDSEREKLLKQKVIDEMYEGDENPNPEYVESDREMIDKADYCYSRLLKEFDLDERKGNTFYFKGYGVDDYIWDPDLMFY